MARASRLQQAYRRRAAAVQSDSGVPRRACAPPATPHPVVARPPADVAVDFVELTEIVTRMRAAFFARRE